MTLPVETFTPLMVPDKFKGIDAAFIADLYDLVFKYGSDVGRAGIQRILSTVEPRPLHVTVMFAGERRHITVSTNASYMTAGADNLVVFGSRAVNSALIIDPKISLDAIRDFIRQFDAQYADFRNATTGERMRVATDVAAPPKLSVDELFRSHPKGYVFSAGTTPKQAAAMLDRPEDVAFVNDAASPCGFRIARKSDVIPVNEAIRVAQELCADFGLASINDVEGLPPAEKRRFEEELLARLCGPTTKKD